jgi:hypothetical protein
VVNVDITMPRNRQISGTFESYCVFAPQQEANDEWPYRLERSDSA